MAESGPWEKYQPAQGDSGPWSKYQPAESTPESAPVSEPGPSDEIPLSSAQNATASGVQSVGRGIADAATGLMKQFAPPEGVGENLAVGLGGPIGVAAYRGMKGLGELGQQATQVPAAIKDINASPDPFGTYMKAGQEMAGQGAGQALVGAGTEGLGRVAPRIPYGRIAKAGIEATPVVGKFMKALEGPEVGAHSPIVVRPGPDVAFKESMPKIGASQPIPTTPGVEPVAADPLKTAISEGRATKIPTRVPASQLEPKVGAVSKIPVTQPAPPEVGATSRIPVTQPASPEVGATSRIPVRPGETPKIGAHETIPVTPGWDTPSVGQTQRIPVRSMTPFGMGAAEGGGLPEPMSAGVSFYPEPNAGPMNQYVGSIPRPEVDAMAQRRIPGAVEHMVKLGRPSIVIPREAEFPTSVRARQILNEFGQPVDQSSTVERIEPIRKKRAENE